MDAKDSFFKHLDDSGRRAPGLTSWTILVTGKGRVSVEMCERFNGKF